MRSMYLVWLEWPERCFRVDTEALRYLKSLVPAGSVVRRVRTEAAFLKALPTATHAIVWQFKKDWFAKAPNLRLLATPGAGRELVAKEGPKGVTIHFGGYHGAIISETVLGFVLAWAHGFFRPELQGDRPWRSAWPRVALSDKCSLVAGTRAVIVGYGRIGHAIGAKLEAMGVAVTGFTRRDLQHQAPGTKHYALSTANEVPSSQSLVLSAKDDSSPAPSTKHQALRTKNYALSTAAKPLCTAAKAADWFILALPSDTGTDGFLDARLIRKLPKRCVVINVGRGNAVDEAALLAALREGRLAGAYLDVFQGEPGFLSANGVLSAQCLVPSAKDDISPELRTKHQALRTKHYALSTAAQPPSTILSTPDLPWNLIKMPHSSAFCGEYIKMCFKELKDEGLI